MTAGVQPDSIEQIAARLDESMAKIGTLDEEPRTVIEHALQSMNELHKQGLVSIVRRLREDDRGRELLYELVDDPGVRMLLSMHGIIRPDPETLARQALERLRPGLKSHGGDVELSHLADGVVYVRLQGACNGCSMAAVTMRDGVEKALMEAIPGLRGVEVLPNDPQVALIALDQIGIRPRDDRVDETAELIDAGWVRAAGLDELADGGVHLVDAIDQQGRDVDAVLVSIHGQVTAFVNACVHEQRSLETAVVDTGAGTLTCPWHGLCFDVSDGQCLTMPGAQLVQLPVRVAASAVWIRPEGA